MTALLRPVVPEVNISTINHHAHAVNKLCRRAVLEGVHRAEFIAVGGLDVGAAAIVDAVVDDEGRLDKAQLIFQLGPGLFSG